MIVRLSICSEIHSDQPRYRSYLAEALARGQGTRERDLAILARLAQRDLVPDAHGWATLAHLQRVAGDEGAATHATERCEIFDSPGVACDGEGIWVVVAKGALGPGERAPEAGDVVVEAARR